MKKELLLKLADALENIKPSDNINFNMGVWYHRAPGCNTVCCAWGVGVAKGIIPEEYISRSDDESYPVVGHTSNESIAECFEITEEMSDYLFNEQQYFGDAGVKPTRVANRIRHLVEGS